ncbi:hypothetical protein ACPPVU_07235 [Mucilaginibacter sp. McL0603]|uniref:hypothetical protein n=1 Tax=Mucilaginibacter sp. McL0603 TaxID=3415670 RepID=UPI003CF08ECC
MSKPLYLLYAFVSILFFTGFGNAQKSDGPITLHDEKLNFIPHEFYIADVADERKDRNTVASLIENNPDHSSAMKQVDLKDGAVVAISGFLNRNLHRDTTLHPVMITLKEFKITETSAPGGRVSGRLAVVFSFSLQLSYNTVHLIDYTSGIRYDRPDSQQADAEAILRHGIEGAMSFFNTWINSQAETNALLAKKVKITFTDYTENPEGDTIYYSANRPLTWADFKDRPRENGFEAEIFTSIGYIERNEVVKGIVNVNMAIKVDLPKNDCWVRGDRNAYTLNHEQRHFDIEKLASEHFKQRLLAIDLPVDNFYGPINIEYLEALRDATRMQKQYDAETQHGRDRGEQERWNEKIDKELISYGIKR